jgi:hypothetical protein
MTTDPSTVDIVVSVTWQRHENAFPRCRRNAHMPNCQAVRRTVGQRNPFAILVGAAAKYPAAMTCASRPLMYQGHLQVDLDQASPDLAVRQGVVRCLTGKIPSYGP